MWAKRLAALALAAASVVVADDYTSTTDLGFSQLSGGDETDTVASVTTDQYSTSTSSTSSQSQAQSNSDHIQYKIRNGEVTSKGVNLGSWLVAENWMTSSADIWKGVSSTLASAGEYTAITQSADPDTIRSHFENHHNTFITEAEIKAIAEAGLNTVRVPVGYWIVGFDHDDPSGKAEWMAFANGTLKYLDLLINDWAKTHNVAVLISIHAAKGSQNGADHSSPSDIGKSHWSDYQENMENSISEVTFLADRYRDEPAFLGIGLLNEPNGNTTQDALYSYYQEAYQAIRGTGNDCVLTVAPLLYEQNPGTMNGFMEAPDYTNVWVEWHPYFVWGYEETSDDDLINVAVKQKFQGDVSQWNARENHNRLFLGEWSFATSGKFANNQEGFYEFCAAQVEVLNQAGGGWTFWSWRVYGDETGTNGWSLRSMLRDERIKQILLPSTTDNSTQQYRL